MSKVAHYLQEHLSGEVTDSLETRRKLSTDASILRIEPIAVAYPRNENDVRKAARFAWELAQRGGKVPITARGGGSSTTGSAIGSGILLVFTPHMNKLLEFNAKKQYIIVEPGATYEKVEEVLYSHGFFLPPYPASSAYATIGGGIASNAIGELSAKYGMTSKYVRQLRVVLSNGEVIDTMPLSKKELSRKMGLSTFEGEVYRSVDAILEENADLISTESQKFAATPNSLGYNLAAVRHNKHFDLTPLFIGSLGTLGFITEATISVVPHNPITSAAMVSLTNLSDLQEALPAILKLNPSVFDFVTQEAIEQVSQINPSQITGALENPKADIHLFIEFDNAKESNQKKAMEKLQKIIEKYDGICELAYDEEKVEKFNKVRQSITTLLAPTNGPKRALPMADDIFVPPEKLVEFITKTKQICHINSLAPALWGYAGLSMVRLMPRLDLSQVGDRQKLFKVSESLFELAKELGGTISATADGRIRAPFLAGLYSPEYQQLIIRLKQIFDPQGVLNPGAKTAANEDIMPLIRDEYSFTPHHHLPRS